MEKFLDFWDKVVLFMTALWMIYIPSDIYYIGDKFPVISLGFGDNITMTLVHSILGWIFLIVTPWGLIMLGTILVWHALMPNISQRAKRFRKGSKKIGDSDPATKWFFIKNKRLNFLDEMIS